MASATPCSRTSLPMSRQWARKGGAEAARLMANASEHAVPTAAQRSAGPCHLCSPVTATSAPALASPRAIQEPMPCG